MEFCFQEENVELREEWKSKFYIKSTFGPIFLICQTVSSALSGIHVHDAGLTAMK